MEKRYLEEQQIIEDSFRLGVQIFESGFRPTFIVGLWRGGSAVGIYVQECLQTLGVQTDHIALRTSYPGLPDYQNMVETPERIRVHGTQYLIENLMTQYAEKLEEEGELFFLKDFLNRFNNAGNIPVELIRQEMIGR